MKKQLVFGMILALMMGIPFMSQAAGDSAAGQSVFSRCTLCHGEQGEGSQTYNGPRIGGLDEDYLLRQLSNFKNGIRGRHERDLFGGQMRPVKESITDAEMVDVAAYIATLNPPFPEVTLQGDVEQGKQLYENCVVCHGEMGEGIPALKSPALAGLNDWYLQRQLQNFRDGVRGIDPYQDKYGFYMTNAVLNLKDDTMIQNLVAYIATLSQESSEQPE